MAAPRRSLRRLLKRLVLWLPLIFLLVLFLAHTITHVPWDAKLFGGFKPATIDANARQVGLALAYLVQTFLAAGFIIYLSGSVGTLILPRLDGFEVLERAALRSLSGLAVLSVSGLVLGMLGLYPPSGVLWGLMVAFNVALWFRWGRVWWSDLRVGISEAWAVDGGFYRWLKWGVAALLAIAFLLALPPPTKWDAMTYHLAGPAKYLAVGRVIGYPENHFLGFPQLVETLFTWAMLMIGPQAAVLIHYWFGALVLLLTFGFLKRLGSTQAGWIAVAVLLITEAFWAAYHWPYNDLALAAYSTAALILVLYWRESGYEVWWLAFAGLMLGCALDVKYTAGGVALGIGILTLWLSRPRGVGRVLLSGVVVTAAALIGFSPWLIKNTILLANPVAPFGWGTSHFDALDQWYYLRPGTGYFNAVTGFDAVGFFLAPIQFSVFGFEGYSPFMSNVCPLWLGLVPFIALGWKERPEAQREFAKAAIVFIIPVYLFWLYSSSVTFYLQQPRLLLGIFPVVAMIGALGLAGLKEIRLDIPAEEVARVLVLASMVLAVVGATLEVGEQNPIPVALGLESTDDYLYNSGMGVHYLAMQQVNKLPDDANIQFLWEPRTYYCTANCTPDSLISLWWHNRQTTPDPFEIARGWADDGVTHVMIFEAGRRLLFVEENFEPLEQDDMEALDELRGSVLKEVWSFEDEYTLYELDMGE